MSRLLINSGRQRTRKIVFLIFFNSFYQTASTFGVKEVCCSLIYFLYETPSSLRTIASATVSLFFFSFSFLTNKDAALIKSF